MNKYPHSFGITSDGFYYVEFYRDNDGNSGYGDNASITRWYGSQADCQRWAERGPEKNWRWYKPVVEYGRNLAE